MAAWYAIRIQIDVKLSSEVIENLCELMLGEDYDFPPSCLRFESWHDYRSPMGGGVFIERVMRDSGVTGRYWLRQKAADECSNADMLDEYVVEFGPGVDPKARANRAREARIQAQLRNSALKYIEALQALEVEPLPLKRKVLPYISIYVPDEKLEEFEIAVREIASTVSDLPET